MKGITPYQLELLQHVSAAPADSPLDFDQLLEKLSWCPSKEAAQFTIRAVIAKKLIAKKSDLVLRRGRKRVCYLLTADGRAVLDPRTALASRARDEPTAEILLSEGTSSGVAYVDEVQGEEGAITLIELEIE